jgi:hypothetical protein
MLLDAMGGLTVVVPQGPCTATEELRVFVDNSNMCVHVVGYGVMFMVRVRKRYVCFVCVLFVFSHIGAQLSHSANPSGGKVVDEAVPIIHVKYDELIRRVEADRVCRRRFVGGVMPDVVVRRWKQLGYSVRSGAQVGACFCSRMKWTSVQSQLIISFYLSLLRLCASFAF